MTSAVTQPTLESLGHNFDPRRIFEDVRLRQCRGCGRVWRFKAANNSFDAVTYVWLKLLEPTGWTMTFNLRFEPGLDEVSRLSPIEMLVAPTPILTLLLGFKPSVLPILALTPLFH